MVENKKIKPLIYLSIFIGMVLIAFFLLFFSRNSKSEKNTSRSISITRKGMAPLFGDSLAPIQIVVFSDLKCSYCKGFWENEFPILEKEILNTRSAYIVWRDLTPSKNELPPTALIYGADKAGKSKEIIQYLFANNGNIREVDFNKTVHSIGIDSIEFRASLGRIDMKNELSQHFEYARSCNLPGTPCIAIQGQLFEGFLSAKEIIERVNKMTHLIPRPNKEIPLLQDTLNNSR